MHEDDAGKPPSSTWSTSAPSQPGGAPPAAAGLGFSVTQATLSRDIRDLGWSRARPTAPTTGRAPTPPARTSPPRGCSTPSRSTSPASTGRSSSSCSGPASAQAQPLAIALDAATLDGVVGTDRGRRHGARGLPRRGARRPRWRARLDRAGAGRLDRASPGSERRRRWNESCWRIRAGSTPRWPCPGWRRRTAPRSSRDAGPRAGARARVGPRARARRRRRARARAGRARGVRRAATSCPRCRPARSTRAATRSPPRSAARSSRASSSRSPRIEGATAIAHGCTGKGNDQVRIDVSARALDPASRSIAPAREWGMTRPRRDRVRPRARHPGAGRRRPAPTAPTRTSGAARSQCGVLEDPWAEPPADVYTLTKRPGRVPGRAGVRRARVRARRAGRGQRRRDAVHRDHRQRRHDRRRPRRRPHRHGREPARRHQVARSLRSARRRGAAPRRTGELESFVSPRDLDAREAGDGGQVRRPGLQRALVLAGARGDRRVRRQDPGARHRRDPREALQGTAPVVGRSRRSRSTTTAWRPTARATRSTTARRKASSRSAACRSRRPRASADAAAPAGERREAD